MISNTFLVPFLNIKCGVSCIELFRGNDKWIQGRSPNGSKIGSREGGRERKGRSGGEGGRRRTMERNNTS